MRPELVVLFIMCVIFGAVVGAAVDSMMSRGRIEVLEGELQQSLAVLCVQHGYAPDVQAVDWMAGGYIVKCNGWNMNVTLNITK